MKTPSCRLSGRFCTARGRSCCGDLFLSASGDHRVVLWGTNPASLGPVLLWGADLGCLRASGCTVGGRVLHPLQPVPWPSRMQDALGILVELPRAARDGGLGSSSTLGFGFNEWVLALPGCPRGSHPAFLFGMGTEPWELALPCPHSLSSASTTGHSAEHRLGPSFSAVLGLGAGQAGPSQRGRVPTAAASWLGELQPLPLLGGPGHKCTFTSRL